MALSNLLEETDVFVIASMAKLIYATNDIGIIIGPIIIGKVFRNRPDSPSKYIPAVIR